MNTATADLAVKDGTNATITPAGGAYIGAGPMSYPPSGTSATAPPDNSPSKPTDAGGSQAGKENATTAPAIVRTRQAAGNTGGEGQLAALKGVKRDPLTASSGKSYEPFLPRIKADSKARGDKHSAYPIKDEQLKNGLFAIGLGSTDLPRINHLKAKAVIIGSTFEEGGITQNKLKNVDYTDPRFMPSTYIDMVTLLASNTAQYDLLLNDVIQAYLQIIDDVKAKYGTASKIILDIAIKHHVESAYGQYIRILGISNRLLEIKAKRKIALIAWLNTLRDEARKASHVIKLMKKAQTEAFLAEETAKRYEADETEESSESDDEAYEAGTPWKDQK